MSKNIVIVGGGTGGGSGVARNLSAKLSAAKITLVNPLPYAVSRPTLPRMTVSAGNDLFETTLIPYDKLFTTRTARSCRVSSRADKKGGTVLLADGKQLPYDVLVLASGSHWEGLLNIPGDSAAVTESIAAGARALKRRRNFFWSGAALTEYAGEIKDVWPSKEVAIVHGSSNLMNSTYPSGFRKGLEKSLRARGVKLVLDDYVDEIPAPGPATIKTRKGTVIEADLVVATRGPCPRTEFVGKSLGAGTLDEKSQIKVKPTFQLLEHPDIFALGDAIDTVEQNQVAEAYVHAPINVITYLSGSGCTMK
ncbi:hypothetical protein B0H17DRAFT_1292305 [Mycena rosella]|uniref:FAD/NAD(P)-binding domain-containing protein n=1 Tax=Mycena rosella TaxID=1033263 RepID=A0AAD7GV31_MYCRO|nr:hypothetical protein B0H17DRAFT_1292305 [Mycena rosella]